MSETIRWALPLLAAGQAQKEITHNEALLAIDRVLQLAVVSRSVSVPPASAAAGAAYVVGDTPIDAWADSAGTIATFDGSGWVITSPRPGCLAWVADEAQFIVFDGSAWSRGGWPAQGLRIGERTVLAAPPVAVDAPAGGTTIDSECRQALNALIAALRNQGVVLPMP